MNRPSLSALSVDWELLMFSCRNLWEFVWKKNAPLNSSVWYRIFLAKMAKFTAKPYVQWNISYYWLYTPLFPHCNPGMAGAGVRPPYWEYHSIDIRQNNMVGYNMSRNNGLHGFTRPRLLFQSQLYQTP